MQIFHAYIIMLSYAIYVERVNAESNYEIILLLHTATKST